MILLLFCYSNGEETKISFIARKAILYGGYINFVISNKIKKKKKIYSINWNNVFFFTFIIKNDEKYIKLLTVIIFQS